MDPYVQQTPAPQGGGKGLSIASMVLGIISVVFCCCLWYIAIPAGIIGLILGIVGIKKSSEGHGMAIAGIITSSIAIILGLVTAVIFISALSSGIYGDTNNMEEFYRNYYSEYFNTL